MTDTGPRKLPRQGLDALIALNRAMRAPSPAAPGAQTCAVAAAPMGLKSVERFRQSWKRIQVQDQVDHALANGPANAGPLNSHRLVLRTLGLMQELSPAYLHQFMGHLDTLLWLDALTPPQAAKPAGKTVKAAARRGATKK